MFQPPNPVEAARQTISEIRAEYVHRTGPINTSPVSTEPTTSAVPKDGYDAAWDGKHCAFNYSYELLLDFPAVPTFLKGDNDGQ